MPNWDPGQYLRFAKQRTQPCVDLLSRIEMERVEYAADLGCGPGNSTEKLADRFPLAKVIGVDNSAEMIAKARQDYPRLEFVQCDARTWASDRPCDVILSNAVFQWVGEHEKLLPRLMGQLSEGGVLAVQMPRNFQSPTHRILREMAGEARWSSKLGEREPYWVQEPAFYYDVLKAVASEVEIWETEYIHVMPDQEAIVEWYKGTGLRPYLEALDEREREEFLGQYLERLKHAYPRQKDGMVLFPFLRIFFLARR